MMDISVSKLDIAISWLLIGAIFFAMRSCEYLQTNIKEEDRRTKMLRVKNIKFKKKGKCLNINSKNLEKADLVMITFEFQKNDWRSKSVHMFRTKDKLLCPVKAWAKVIERLRNTVDKFDGETPVCAFHSKNETILILGDMVRSRLRTIVKIMGEENLEFLKEDIGLHLIRAGGQWQCSSQAWSLATAKT